uniref:NADH dehydrogenase [ubiquinone] 1 beta subcomplex subunit 11, mitochondrial n=1 Tax=Falco tinnunculus TaxID=100819 RepID=A0A8C4UAK4_FALTI
RWGGRCGLCGPECAAARRGAWSVRVCVLGAEPNRVGVAMGGLQELKEGREKGFMEWGRGLDPRVWQRVTQVPGCHQNPDYHGFSEDPDVDVLNMQAVFFTGISLAIVLGSVFLHYLPDYGLQQWARREAELQVRERERRGLPLLDSNYYDPARLALPPPE